MIAVGVWMEFNPNQLQGTKGPNGASVGLAQRLGSKKLSAVKGGKLSNSLPSTGLRHAEREQSGKASTCVCVWIFMAETSKQSIYVFIIYIYVYYIILYYSVVY